MTDVVRVLVVEDQPLIAMDLEDQLIARGYAVVGPKATVAEALDSLRTAAPDVALLDVDLGGRTSFEVAAELRRLGIPFVFATGFSAVERAIPADLADAPIIDKPWNLDEVLAFLHEHAPRHR